LTYQHQQTCLVKKPGSASFRHRHCQVAIDWYTCQACSEASHSVHQLVTVTAH
jgi:hypothetical protein